jgi:hypothetical protein
MSTALEADPFAKSSTKQPEHQVGETKNINGVTYVLNQNHRWELEQGQDPEAAHGLKPATNSEKTASKIPPMEQGGAGWKLHLATDHPEEISATLKKLGIKHKVGSAGGQEGKDLTAYIGSRDKANEIAKHLNERHGHQLKDPHGETLADDTNLGGKVMGRFDAGKNDKEFHQYGSQGVPHLMEHADPFNPVAPDKARDAATKRLEEKYGEHFTGSKGRAAKSTEEQSPLDQPGEQPTDPQADHQARVAFVSEQLPKVDKKIGGIMRAMQQSPDFKNGAEYATKSVHPKQAGAIYQSLQQNAGKSFGGGEVRDLGNGWLGFSSPAGAMVVSAPGKDGQHTVHYTANTGLVQRAMQGGQEGKAGQLAGEEQGAGPGLQPGQSLPPQEGQGTFDPLDPQGEAAAEKATGLKPWRQPGTSPPKTGDNSASQPGTSSPPTPADTSRPGPVLAHEQTPEEQRRIAAEEAGANYENALNEWEKAVARGADRKTLAAHRSKVGSLKAIWKQRQEAGKVSKPAEKPTAAAKPKHSSPVNKAMQKAAAALGIALGGEQAVSAGEAEPQAAVAPKAPPAKEKAWNPTGKKNPRGPDVWKQHLQHHLTHSGLKDHAENLAAIKAAVDRGDISNQAQLKRVLATAKKLHERGNMAESDTPALKESLRRRGNRADKGPRKSFDAIVKEAANDHGTDEKTMRGIVDEVWKERLAYHNEREMAKEAARQFSGLTAADVNRLENQGLDSGSDHPKMKGLDGLGRSLASQFPILGWGKGYVGGENADHTEKLDYADVVWNLIREGNNPAPSNTSDEFWNEVNAFMHRGGGSGGETSISDEEREQLFSTPFAKEGLRVRYGVWDESKHPRGQPENAGEFAPASAAEIAQHNKEIAGHRAEMGYRLPVAAAERRNLQLGRDGIEALGLPLPGSISAEEAFSSAPTERPYGIDK